MFAFITIMKRGITSSFLQIGKVLNGLTMKALNLSLGNPLRIIG